MTVLRRKRATFIDVKTKQTRSLSETLFDYIRILSAAYRKSALDASSGCIG